MGSPFLVSQMQISLPVYQTKINLLPIRHASPDQILCAGVWKDALQRPVEMSQTLTTPSESLEITIPSFGCRLMDLIGAEADGMDSESVPTGPVDKVPICQNLIDRSLDNEIREEENAREEMLLVCPMKVSMGWGFELVMSQV
jgi:hypothetical protein